MHLSLTNFLDNKFYDHLVSELKAEVGQQSTKQAETGNARPLYISTKSSFPWIESC